MASRRGGQSRRRRWSRGWPRKREGDEGVRGLGLSLDQYSHLLPAGPGRTLRSETHLLADIKPPFLLCHPIPSTPATSPSFFLPFVPPRPLGRTTLSRRTLAICIRRGEARPSLFAGKKIFRSVRRTFFTNSHDGIGIVLAKPDGCANLMLMDAE